MIFHNDMIMQTIDPVVAFCMQISMCKFTGKAVVIAEWHCAFIGAFYHSLAFFCIGKSWIVFEIFYFITVSVTGNSFRGFLCQPVPNTGALIQNPHDPIKKQNKCGQV